MLNVVAVGALKAAVGSLHCVFGVLVVVGRRQTIPDECTGSAVCTCVCVLFLCDHVIGSVGARGRTVGLLILMIVGVIFHDRLEKRERAQVA